ncbi:P-loop containing nucleoside triphosphate hydrolase protein [Amylocystis lapponica]|nr:P-loop containing nucleoside triphosphate hydrolase protein [Amylocystis lapponica]
MPVVFRRTSQRLKPATIAIMGPTGVGKTSFINLASGSQFDVGMTLESSTSGVQLSRPFPLEGYSITLIDTPGFDDTTKSDAEIWRRSPGSWHPSKYEKGQMLNGIIYLHRISDNRVGGTAMRNFNFFRDLCGPDALQNSIVVSNMWGEVAPDVGAAREKELVTKDIFFKPALDAGAETFRHDDTVGCAHLILRKLAEKTPRPLLVQQEMVDKRMNVAETAAGLALLGALAEQERKHLAQLRELESEIDEAIREQDEEDQRELEAARKRILEELERNRAERRSILEEQQTLPLGQAAAATSPASDDNPWWRRIWTSIVAFLRRLVRW